MKKILYLTLLLLLAPCFLPFAFAQEQIRIWREGSSKRLTTSMLEFSNDGTAFTSGGDTYSIDMVDSITVVHTIYVTYSGNNATVDLGHAPDVTVTTDGAHVSILSTNVKNELELVLQGESTQGSLTYDGPLKCKFYLNGLNLKSNRGAAIDIQCGKRVDLILVEGTNNILADAAGGTQKAALYCKGHLEVSGSGTLTVSGNTKHAIATKEYMELKSSTGKITVNKAVSDALHVGQYFLMNGGTLIVSGQEGDGLQVEVLTLDDDVTPNPDKENNGQMFINGGKLNITASGDCAKGIKAPRNMTVTGGTFTIKATGDGSKGISVSGNMTINQDSNTTVFVINATGGIYEDEDENETYCMGMNIKGNLAITAGSVTVTNKGVGTKGIQYGGTYTKGASATVKPTPSRK